MKLVCCSCSGKIAAGKEGGGRVMASFSGCQRGLCDECFVRARASIVRVYGDPAPTRHTVIRRPESGTSQ